MAQEKTGRGYPIQFWRVFLPFIAFEATVILYNRLSKIDNNITHLGLPCPQADFKHYFETTVPYTYFACVLVGMVLSILGVLFTHKMIHHLFADCSARLRATASLLTGLCALFICLGRFEPHVPGMAPIEQILGLELFSKNSVAGLHRIPRAITFFASVHLIIAICFSTLPNGNEKIGGQRVSMWIWQAVIGLLLLMVVGLGRSRIFEKWCVEAMEKAYSIDVPRIDEALFRAFIINSFYFSSLVFIPLLVAILIRKPETNSVSPKKKNNSKQKNTAGKSSNTFSGADDSSIANVVTGVIAMVLAEIIIGAARVLY